MPADKRVGKPTKLRSVGWAFLTLNAIGVGFVSLRYVLPHVPFPAPLPNFYVRREWLIAHAVFSSVALLSGPWQFLTAIRIRTLRIHRWMGQVYCGAIVAGWLSSLPLAAHAQTGQIASAGFLLLGAVWAGTTAAGYFTIRRGQVEAHRDWMIRSYALTAAAITLRIYLPILPLAGIPFNTGYPVIAWICWIPNLLFAEWLVHRSRVRNVRFSPQQISA